MSPAGVASPGPARRRLRAGRVAAEPQLDAVVIELLIPQEPSIRLALHETRIGTEARVLHRGVELVRLVRLV